MNAQQAMARARAASEFEDHAALSLMTAYLSHLNPSDLATINLKEVAMRCRAAASELARERAEDGV